MLKRMLLVLAGTKNWFAVSPELRVKQLVERVKSFGIVVYCLAFEKMHAICGTWWCHLLVYYVLLSKHCFRGLRQERMEKQIDDTRAREKSQRDSQREMQVLGPAKGTRALNFVLCWPLGGMTITATLVHKVYNM